MDGVADTPEKMEKYIGTIYNKANEMDTSDQRTDTYMRRLIQTGSRTTLHRFQVNDYFNDCAEDIETGAGFKGCRVWLFQLCRG